MNFLGFDPEQALNYAKELAYPRLAGSQGERRACEQITARLEAAGWQVEKLLFRYSTKAEDYLKRGIACGLLAIAGMNLSIVADPPLNWLAPAFSPLMVALIFFLPRLYADERARAVEALPPGSGLETGQKLPSMAANLYAELPDLPDHADLPHLILMAHYDSKSQNLPLVVRVACFAVIILAGLASAILAPLSVLQPALLPAAWLTGLATGFFALPLLLLRVGDRSPGAVDNASGAGLLLHLAEILAEEREWRGKIRIGCLFTSAEELGLLGALAFLQARGEQLRRRADGKGTFVLNFDGIGIEGDLHLAGDGQTGRLEEALCISSQRLGCRLKRLRLPGILFDHLPFAQSGLEAVSLASVGRASRVIHTPGDEPGKLHPDGFRQAGEIALAAITALLEREARPNFEAEQPRL